MAEKRQKKQAAKAFEKETFSKDKEVTGVKHIEHRQDNTFSVENQFSASEKPVSNLPRDANHLYTSSLNFAQPCVFVKQLPGPILCAPPGGGDPLSRSYGVNLPSSLTVNLSSASVFSTRPPVSVCGTGRRSICLAGFLGSLITAAITSPRRTRCTFPFQHSGGICLP